MSAVKDTLKLMNLLKKSILEERHRHKTEKIYMWSATQKCLKTSALRNPTIDY